MSWEELAQNVTIMTTAFAGIGGGIKWIITQLSKLEDTRNNQVSALVETVSKQNEVIIETNKNVQDFMKQELQNCHETTKGLQDKLSRLHTEFIQLKKDTTNERH